MFLASSFPAPRLASRLRTASSGLLRAFPNRRLLSSTTTTIVSNDKDGLPVLNSEIVADVVDPMEDMNSATVTDQPSFLFLHGLLGNGRNLRSFAKAAVRRTSVQSGTLLDLRGHGGSVLPSSLSQQFPSPNTFRTLAQDVHRTIRTLADAPTAVSASPPFVYPTSVIGHSLGGRIALQYAMMYGPDDHHENKRIPLRSIWLLDTVPGQADRSVERVVSAVNDIQKNNADTDSRDDKPDKKDLLRLLTERYELTPPIAQWLLSSYDIESRSFSFDIDVAVDLLNEFPKQRFDECVRRSLDTQQSTEFKIHLVRGGKNDGWTVEALDRLEKLQKEYPEQFFLHVLPKAGHWVHIDDRDGLVDIIRNHS